MDDTHFWEYELTDSHGVHTWQRYDPTAQSFIFRKFKNNKLALLKIRDTDFEIIFDHENGNHRHRDVQTRTECAVRITLEVIVDDWNVFKAMIDIDISKITKLSLGGTLEGGRHVPKINGDDIEELMKRISDCKSLQILDLTRNDLTEASGVTVGKAVGTHTTLVQLLLSGNELKENGGAAIMHGLKNNTTLRLLSLGRNNIGENFGDAIQQDLTSNTGLHTLILTDNMLGTKGAVAVIRGLKHNTTLRVLDLSSNKLDENFGVAIQDDLPSNTGLHTLMLGFNDVGDPSGVAIAKAITVNTTLRQLQ